MWNSQFDVKPGEAVGDGWGHYRAADTGELLFMVDRQSLGLQPLQDPMTGVADFAIVRDSELPQFGLTRETVAPFTVGIPNGTFLGEHGDELVQAGLAAIGGASALGAGGATAAGTEGATITGAGSDAVLTGGVGADTTLGAGTTVGSDAGFFSGMEAADLAAAGDGLTFTGAAPGTVGADAGYFSGMSAADLANAGDAVPMSGGFGLPNITPSVGIPTSGGGADPNAGGLGLNFDANQLLAGLVGGGLGLVGADQLSDALMDIYERSRADREPFRQQALSWMNDPNLYLSGPGQASMDAVLRGLSVHGNPAGIPSSQALAGQYALRDWRDAVTGFGNLGLAGADSRDSIAAQAAGANASGFDALGYGLSQAIAPRRNVLSDLLRNSPY